MAVPGQDVVGPDALRPERASTLAELASFRHNKTLPGPVPGWAGEGTRPYVGGGQWAWPIFRKAYNHTVI